MTETKSAINKNQKWDMESLLAKVLELQDLLVASQESNLLLSAQARELERIARDTDDLKVELTAQNLILADKSRENKWLHQELSRVTTGLDVRMQENERLVAMITDLQHQLRLRESERDALSVKLNEYEMLRRREAQQQQQIEPAALSKDQSWFNRFKGKS